MWRPRRQPRSNRLVVYNNNGSNGHLFYVGGDLMMRRGMLPIIMFPDGDLRIVLHLVYPSICSRKHFWNKARFHTVHLDLQVKLWY